MNGQPVHICKNCGFIYVRCRRSAAELAVVWAKEFGQEYAYDPCTPLMAARHAYIAEMVDQQYSLSGKDIADIGGGKGQFMHLLSSKYGANVFGIEPSKTNCKFIAERGLEYFVGSLDDYVSSAAPPRRFDIVTMLWTLEATRDCIATLQTAREMLTDSGLIVVATGSRILVPFAKPLDRYLGPQPADLHPFRFSTNSLHAILMKTGYVPVFTNDFLNDAISLCVIARKNTDNTPVSPPKDDYREIVDFFERWHQSSGAYANRQQ